MAAKPDLIDWFFNLSLFKQLFTIMLLGPLAASIWALVDDWKRPWAARASEQVADEREMRKAA